MITTNIFLYALPATAWIKNANWGNSHVDIGAFIDDALGIEKRIQKGVNQENERSRYTLCCNRLEASVRTLGSTSATTTTESFQSALQIFQLPFISLSSQYLDMISLMYRRYPDECSSIRLGASFFPFDMIEPHLSKFIAFSNELGIGNQVDICQRITFYKAALKFQCGVIEIQDPFYSKNDDLDTSHYIIDSVDQGKEEHLPQLFPQQLDDDYEEDENISVTVRRKAFDILYEQIKNAINLASDGKEGAVNFSNQPHNIITEVLNELVYSETGKVERPVFVRVHYADGSQGKPFPLLCLPKRTDDELNIFQQASPLKVALLSMRHLSMDKDVDMAWFRNREVSKSRAFGETDEFCYEYTKKLLEQSRAEEILKLFLYQTGLQPAVIGFYRALTEELLYRSTTSPSLEVTPHFHMKKSGYRKGRSWN